MKNAGYFIGGLLAGAAIGAAIALLYAPRKGEDTRREIKKNIQDLEGNLINIRDRIRDKGGEIKSELKDKIQEIERRIQFLTRELDESSDNTSTDQVKKG